MGNVAKFQSRNEAQERRHDVVNEIKNVLTRYNRGEYKSIAVIASKESTIGTYWDGYEMSDMMVGVEILRQRLMTSIKGDSD